MGCPTMMNYLGNVDFYLSFEDELKLTNNQVDKLKEIRETYQRDAISKSSDLMEKMFELNSLLREDEISLSKLKEVNKEIEEIQTELRYNNLEGYVKAINVLNEEQLNDLRTMLFRGYPGIRPGMMR
jgi:Spy/CpxP family protein refolding chaperone